MTEAVLLSDVVSRRPSETACLILRELIVWGYVSHDRLVSLLCDYREDGGPLWVGDYSNIYVHRLRPYLRPGWTIQNWHSQGYRLVQEQRMAA